MNAVPEVRAGEVDHLISSRVARRAPLVLDDVSAGLFKNTTWNIGGDHVREEVELRMQKCVSVLFVKHTPEVAPVRSTLFFLPSCSEGPTECWITCQQTLQRYQV